MKKTKSTVYVALSLTHVKSDAEKNEVRSFLKWLEQTFNIELLMWAFDVEVWQPRPVPNIYDYDSERVAAADLMIVLYLSSEGSDGRGGEVVQRSYAQRPVIACAKAGVQVSRYPTDCLMNMGVTITRFTDFTELYPCIRQALDKLE